MTLTVGSSGRSSLDSVDAVAVAEQIYREELLPRYADSHKGRYIVVDGVSGDHEIARSADDDLVGQRLVARRPDAITYGTCVGNDPDAGLGLHPSWEDARNDWPWSQIPFDDPTAEWPKPVRLVED